MSEDLPTEKVEDVPLCSGRVKFGVDWELEGEADRILADFRRESVRKHSDMKDYLTASQLDGRLSREVFTESGVPDSRIMSGLFRRAYAAPRQSGPRVSRESDE